MFSNLLTTKNAESADSPTAELDSKYTHKLFKSLKSLQLPRDDEDDENGGVVGPEGVFYLGFP